LHLDHLHEQTDRQTGHQSCKPHWPQMAPNSVSTTRHETDRDKSHT
jgi:hypothetical protein